MKIKLAGKSDGLQVDQTFAVLLEKLRALNLFQGVPCPPLGALGETGHGGRRTRSGEVREGEGRSRRP